MLRATFCMHEPSFRRKPKNIDRNLLFYGKKTRFMEKLLRMCWQYRNVQISTQTNRVVEWTIMHAINRLSSGATPAVSDESWVNASWNLPRLMAVVSLFQYQAHPCMCPVCTKRRVVHVYYVHTYVWMWKNHSSILACSVYVRKGTDCWAVGFSSAFSPLVTANQRN